MCFFVYVRVRACVCVCDCTHTLYTTLLSSLQFDWLQHFQTFFSEVDLAANITMDTPVVVRTPDYFTNLSAFLMELEHK